MIALIFNKKNGWETSKGFEMKEVSAPALNEKENKTDAHAVIIKVHYAGVCGSDRGIWLRHAFRDQILGSLEMEQKEHRIVGHEFFGEVVQVGSRVEAEYHIRKGDFVSCESHVICNQCFQCVRGEKHVCTNEKILGISHDGAFAELVKVPAHIVWKTNTSKIRPEVAAMQEPFGNAVHAARKVDLRGKTVALCGLGPIGLFAALVAKGLGASTIIGIEPNEKAASMARELGVDYVIPLKPQEKTHPFEHDQNIVKEIFEITGGIGVDVSFEMAGFNSSVNNAILSTRRGGDVILFGIKSGNFTIEHYDRLIVRGLTLHAVIGRRVFETWETTRSLLEDTRNGIQEKMFNVILQRGEGTILPIKDYTVERFEQMMLHHPKILIQF
ncbi:alcohol dehydrogenase catalytic domain-containing protein [Candidatus Uhrbacteria bacterium]|nr:alcohol dehydrogenase catalytic domain-containing protein [Candidatus Uhrbacteria bacterium]